MGIRQIFAVRPAVAALACLSAATLVLVTGVGSSAAPAELVQTARVVETFGIGQVAAKRTVYFDTLKTTDYVAGTLQATGRLSPAPAKGSRIALQRWNPTLKRWEEVGHGASVGANITIKTKLTGSVRTYRLAIGPQGAYAAAGSPQKAFGHYVWRGAFRQAPLAKGGKGRPVFAVAPAAEAPRRDAAELSADKAGNVWGDLNTTGCTWIKNWLGNLTDGTVRTSVRNGATVLGTVDQRQETETWLNRRLNGSTRTRLQVADVASGYGPLVAVESSLLCTN